MAPFSLFFYRSIIYKKGGVGKGIIETICFQPLRASSSQGLVFPIVLLDSHFLLGCHFVS